MSDNTNKVKLVYKCCGSKIYKGEKCICNNLNNETIGQSAEFIVKNKNSSQLTGNEKRKDSCKKIGGKKKEKGHKRENDFNKKYNPENVGTIEYGAKSDCVISEESYIIPLLKDNFGLFRFNTSNKSGNSIQFTLGTIPELESEDNLEYIRDNDNSRKLFSKYLKKSESDRPADLLVYKNKETKKWEFFKMDDVIKYIVTKCIWRKLDTGRLKGDFHDNSKNGKRQYLTYEYRTTHKSYFLGLNGGKGIQFINLLKSDNYGISYYSEHY